MERVAKGTRTRDRITRGIMNRQELLRAVRLARADWHHAEDNQEAKYEAVKQTPEYLAFKEAEKQAERLWKQKNQIEDDLWKDCERTGDDFYKLVDDEIR